jgi:hypothetical protein
MNQRRNCRTRSAGKACNASYLRSRGRMIRSSKPAQAHVAGKNLSQKKKEKEIKELGV